ncbi:MAG: alpha/beta fold hydrolase [Anaerolineaceae bacterium]
MNQIAIHREMLRLKNGIDIFLRDTRTDNPAILCLHGRWGRGETWVNFMLHYGDRYRVIAPDQRGHGLSGKPVSKYTSEEMAVDMIQLLDFLKIKPAIVVGHSMGGTNAGFLAANFPEYVKAVAILDKSANCPETPNLTPPEKLPLDDRLTTDWPLPFESLRQAQEFILAAMEGEELSYRYFMNSLEETVDGYRMMFSGQAMAANIAYYENWFHLLPEIKCPGMLVRASSHEAVPDADWQKMKSLLLNGSSYEMSHPDHNVHLSNEAEFYGYFDEFLQKIEGKKSDSSDSLA